ncbi:MAG: virulence RhuM family protein [Rhodocyclaceae bacterium]|nr:virulence RhuM family protein [Rhodocyclaceae bacterium]MCC8999813.1 virulence RhuM family protein [Candidatus Contendobacter sp.]MBK6554467.1 virulence RhuM family protein [Rhodocyclaceae bacterium]MBK6677577.1 virulence RhuM family protein [Rhodocyclaceae bacterium]MBK9310253.1 virulence RhuM family protein [Rhodocyclaceae bacterium]
MTDKALPQMPNFILYTSPSGDAKVDVVLQDETIWMTQKAMESLFNVSKSTLSGHLRNIFSSGELSREATVRNFRTVQDEGEREVARNLDYYNLDAIISVGYRVNSYEATQFRVWATRTLKEFVIKGFVLDDARLKQGSQVFGKDYFDELLERIREIRASERRFYQKITDIYALSADYDKSAPVTKDFFATVQNKLHWAITGKTSAEIIYQFADAGKPHMGLMTFKNAPDGKVLKSDVAVAKNYLSEQHIRELERVVSAYLDLAENRAERQIVMKMADWVSFLNGFLELSNYPILQDAGKVSAEMARLKAEQEYEKFRVRQDREYVSDFDKAVKALKRPAKKDK